MYENVDSLRFFFIEFSTVFIPKYKHVTFFSVLFGLTDGSVKDLVSHGCCLVVGFRIGFWVDGQSFPSTKFVKAFPFIFLIFGIF